MRQLQVLTLALLAASLASRAQALPQDEPSKTTVQTTTSSTKLARVGADLVGKALVNEKNEPLGKVEDVVVHPRGDVAFVEFSGAGSLNTGTKRFPVPWRALDRNDAGQFVLRSTPADFAHSPSYEKKPDMKAIGWWDETDKAYAKLVAAKASPAEASSSLAPTKILYLGNDLRARGVEDPDGQKIASMHELVVDTRTGRVAFVVLAVGGALGGGEKMIAVPWDALKVMPDKSNPQIERLTLATSKDKLEKAPEFRATTEGWEEANEPDYITRVYEFYSVTPYWVIEKKPAAPEKP